MRFLNSFKPALLPLLFVFISCSERKEYPLKHSLINVLGVLDSSLVSLQNTDPVHPDHGALWCRHCKLYHTRAAEAVYPFAYLFTITKEKKFLDASISLGNWLIRQQFPDGSWKETPEEWTGTSTDQLLMMAGAFPIVRDHLSDTERKSWLRSMTMAGNYLVDTMTPGFASINYVATTTASLMELHTIVPDEKYVQKARHLARQVIAKMDDDLFITGEGGRVFEAKYGVDLAYNMEMSLWGLALYARLSGDITVMNKVIASTRRHLYFIYPDGSLDGSWGIRSNKWTCFGGATSDGIQVLFSLLGQNDKRFYTASARNLEFLKTCMKGGFVGYGPHHREVMKDEPCIYPTFAKAKNLALAHSFLDVDPLIYPPLPSDQNGLNFFPTLNVATIRTGNFCSTVTAYGYKDPKGSESKYMFRPTGGAVSNLWLKNYGFLTASSQTEYHRWEPMHFPEAPRLKSLTPRIEFENEKGYFTNLFEFDATCVFSRVDNEILANVYGELKNRDQEAGGIGYSYQYTFADNKITKKIHVRYHSIRDTVRIVEPVIQYPDTRMDQVDEKTISIKAGTNLVHLDVIKGKAVLTLGVDAADYWSPYPALRAIPVVMTLIPDAGDMENEITYSYRLK